MKQNKLSMAVEVDDQLVTLYKEATANALTNFASQTCSHLQLEQKEKLKPTPPAAELSPHHEEKRCST